MVRMVSFQGILFFPMGILQGQMFLRIQERVVELCLDAGIGLVVVGMNGYFDRGG